MNLVAFKCGGCGRVWTIDDNPDEWQFGHDCEEPNDTEEEERQALCCYANADEVGKPHGKYGYTTKLVPSTTPALNFFEAQPDKPFDRFYCGCYGWE